MAFLAWPFGIRKLGQVARRRDVVYGLSLFVAILPARIRISSRILLFFVAQWARCCCFVCPFRLLDDILIR